MGRRYFAQQAGTSEYPDPPETIRQGVCGTVREMTVGVTKGDGPQGGSSAPDTPARIFGILEIPGIHEQAGDSDVGVRCHNPRVSFLERTPHC